MEARRLRVKFTGGSGSWRRLRDAAGRQRPHDLERAQPWATPGRADSRVPHLAGASAEHCTLAVTGHAAPHMGGGGRCECLVPGPRGGHCPWSG
jgi:hypothetical protein